MQNLPNMELIHKLKMKLQNIIIQLPYLNKERLKSHLLEKMKVEWNRVVMQALLVVWICPKNHIAI